MLEIVKTAVPDAERAVERIPAANMRKPSLVDWLREFSALLSEQAEEADAAAMVSSDAWHALRRSGLAMAPFPPMYGGEDLIEPERHQELCTVLRMTGAGDLSVARLLEGHVNAVALVCRYGTAPQVSALARRVAGEALSGVWGAEDARGLHAAWIGHRWHLDGRKILASGAGFITAPLVTAMTAEGQALFLVDLEPGERADLTNWTAQGMRSSATGTVDLSGITLSADCMVGAPGDFMRQPYFSGGAWRFCAVHVGAMERLVDLFRDHLTSRARQGDPYQLQRIAQCTAAASTARFWVEEAARRLAEQDVDTDSAVAFANLTRMVTERTALDILETVQRGVGLGSFMRPNPIERIARDLSTYLRQPVPDMAMADAARLVLASKRSTGDLWSPGRES